MLSPQLRAAQSPLKERYRTDPDSARVRSTAAAQLIPGEVACTVQTGTTTITAGLHRATGGDGSERCSADILLEALVACAGVTLAAVSTSMRIPFRAGSIRAEGEWDARGTLAVSKEVPVGLTAVRLFITLDTEATAEQVSKLLQLTERFCIVAQTLSAGVPVTVSREG